MSKQNIEKAPISFTEQHANFLERTRLFTKEPKDWEGKKKPDVASTLDPRSSTAIMQTQHNKIMQEFFKTVKFSHNNKYGEKKETLFTCPYCCEFYNYWNEHQYTCGGLDDRLEQDEFAQFVDDLCCEED